MTCPQSSCVVDPEFEQNLTKALTQTTKMSVCYNMSLQETGEKESDMAFTDLPRKWLSPQSLATQSTEQENNRENLWISDASKLLGLQKGHPSILPFHNQTMVVWIYISLTTKKPHSQQVSCPMSFWNMHSALIHSGLLVFCSGLLSVTSSRHQLFFLYHLTQARMLLEVSRTKLSHSTNLSWENSEYKRKHILDPGLITAPGFHWSWFYRESLSDCLVKPDLTYKGLVPSPQYTSINAVWRPSGLPQSWSTHSPSYWL